MKPSRSRAVRLFEGKTYSLVGEDLTSDEYYTALREEADRLQLPGTSLAQSLDMVRSLGRNRRKLKRLASASSNGSRESALVRALKTRLGRFTTAVESHLNDLSPVQRWDRTLGMGEEQYHLFMLEIELTRRLNLDRFRKADTRLAFLPHCLREVSAECRSVHRGDDYICKGCTTGCTINRVSKLLRRHGVTPYIWMSANLSSLLRRLQGEGRTVGVVGIACVPELVHGLRSCMRAGVPAVGIPLDANRCARWWGRLYPNTVNEEELETLLGEETKVYPRNKLGSLNPDVGIQKVPRTVMEDPTSP
ncbi:MAG: DUF116 domain-containing protein [Bacteroidota bacterium]